MSNKPSSNVEKAIAFIAERGRVRTASKKISANLYISLDNNSRLHISTGDDYIDLDPAAVRELGQFMADTEPAWA